MTYVKRQFGAILLLTALLLIVMPALEGCKKSEPAASAEAEEASSAEIEQTTCPVMEGNKIDKDVFVMYKGKKVYFCCPSCKAEFEKDPEKYIPKLPQFQK